MSTKSTDDKLIRTFAAALNALSEELKNPELPTQTALTLLHVMLYKEIPMGDLEKLTGVSQAAVSRNITRLSNGLPPKFAGAHVLEAYEDPYYRKRKLVKLTPQGERLKLKLITTIREST